MTYMGNKGLLLTPIGSDWTLLHNRSLRLVCAVVVEEDNSLTENAHL